LGLKVSDEFTVPLCAIHHGEIHSTGNERQWWEQRKIDPLAIANALWRQGRMPVKPSEMVNAARDDSPSVAQSQADD
jgi:hypothetical protein